MDWNWFFSSLCQSAAAIVGFFGGFIITKILGNQTSFSEKKGRLQELVRAAEKLSADANSHYFNWYNKHKNSDEMEKVDRMLEDEDGLNAESIYDKLNFSPFTPCEVILKRIGGRIEARLERQRRRQEELREQALTRKPFGIGSAVSLDAYIPPALPRVSMINEQLTKEREEIDASLRECRYHVTRVSDFYDSVAGNPESSPQITYSLATVAVLFYVGVIYPLSFMPASTSASPDFGAVAFAKAMWGAKGGLLTAISVIFTAVLSMFFWMNRNLKYGNAELERLRSFSSIGAYSSFFAVKDANDELYKSRKSQLEHKT